MGNQVTTNESDLEIAQDAEITLEKIIDTSPQQRSHASMTGVVTTLLHYNNTLSKYFINNPLNSNELIHVAKSTVRIDESTVGNEVLVVFEENNVHKPVITGIVQALKNPSRKLDGQKCEVKSSSAVIDDTERLVFNAEREIILQCGKSSIHLTKAGKIIIRGKYLLSRSTGLNSIKGGSVSIN